MVTKCWHNHTCRCNHAHGTEREYIGEAIRRGVQVIGFSDHSPYLFDDGYNSSFRMKREEAEGYFNTLRALRDEYRDRIDIRLGVEIEYYPKYFTRTVSWLKDLGLEYMIMGQHMIGNEPGAFPSGRGTDDPDMLKRYTDQVLEGISTGEYFYIAHPDMFRFTGDPALYQAALNEICRAAKARGIPVEYNLLGLVDQRNYPCDALLEAVKETGCDLVLGCDAHAPERVADPDEISRAEAYLSQHGITRHVTNEIGGKQ